MALGPVRKRKGRTERVVNGCYLWKGIDCQERNHCSRWRNCAFAGVQWTLGRRPVDASSDIDGSDDNCPGISREVIYRFSRQIKAISAILRILPISPSSHPP